MGERDRSTSCLSQMLTIADGGGRGGVGTPFFLADVICEQPLMCCDFECVHRGWGWGVVRGLRKMSTAVTFHGRLVMGED